ncbi:MAG: WG repeat-containing protein [Abditibacteriota bacterium]|nr:WG repeat-containing protein [Abditibacteriota bacterium]
MKKSCLKECLITFLIFIFIIITFLVIIFVLFGKAFENDNSLFNYHRLPDEEFALVSSDYNIEDRFFGKRSFIESDNIIKLYKTKKDYENDKPTARVSPIRSKDETSNFKTIKCEYKFEKGLHCYYLNGKCILKSQVEFSKAVTLWEDYYIFSTNDFNYSLVKDGKVLLQSNIMMFVRGLNLVVKEKEGSVKIYNKDLKVIYSCEDFYGFSDGVYCVVKNEKMGYVDENGNEVIKPQYNYFSGKFCNGKCFVNKGRKCYLIDKNNNILFKCEPGNDRFSPLFLDDGRYLVIVKKR